jgi:hypothetical protein
MTPEPEVTFGLSLARLEHKLDVIGVKLDMMGGTILDHEGRLRALEKRIWMAAGAAAVVGGAVGQFFVK